VAAVDAARDKFATRAIMQDAGLPTPANCLIEKAADLAAAAEKVGFPAVIKPIAGAGSMGVVRVDTAEELARVYAKVVADMGRAVITSGALVYAPESGETGADSKARTRLLRALFPCSLCAAAEACACVLRCPRRSM
jgi:carnosine synthase